jgi:hypothetical protein
MTDREKVIRAIDGCINTDDYCNDCDYDGCVFHHGSCEKDLLADALSLLKEQEARVMTLDEVKAFDWDYCYLEEERLPGKEYRSVCGDYALTCITWPCIASMRIQHGDDSYGKKWRCWSAKPTDEQRQAVKWE